MVNKYRKSKDKKLSFSFSEYLKSVSPRPESAAECNPQENPPMILASPGFVAAGNLRELILLSVSELDTNTIIIRPIKQKNEVEK